MSVHLRQGCHASVFSSAAPPPLHAELGKEGEGDSRLFSLYKYTAKCIVEHVLFCFLMYLFFISVLGVSLW